VSLKHGCVDAGSTLYKVCSVTEAWLYWRRFNTVQGLQYLIADQLQQLDAARDCVVDNLDKLHSTDPQLLVDEVTQCCLRPPLNFQFPK